MENRWRFQVLSPLNGDVMWQVEARTMDDILFAWKCETGNRYLKITKSIIKNTCDGNRHNQLLRVYKIGEWAQKYREKLEKESVLPTPVPSEISVIDDYQTEFETDLDDYETVYESSSSSESEDQSSFSLNSEEN